jgi:peptidoglycan/xylan/chitin deacetylase (PgdA/CDA1 family)
MYHDIVCNERVLDVSGFQSPGAAAYKVPENKFEEHIKIIYENQREKVALVSECEIRKDSIFITFDDGGKSFIRIADILEKYGFRGNFFVTTDYIDTPGFLTEDDIKSLHNRGHIIGSHSCSHPAIFSKLSAEQVTKEWQQSIKILKKITGSDVLTASIPGGFYSKEISRTAGFSGIRYLFTSEPVKRVWSIGNCKILGRYTITNSMPSIEVKNIIDGRLNPAFKQYLLWNTKKILKKFGGNYYMKLRKAISK